MSTISLRRVEHTEMFLAKFDLANITNTMSAFNELFQFDFLVDVTVCRIEKGTVNTSSSFFSTFVWVRDPEMQFWLEEPFGKKVQCDDLSLSLSLSLSPC